MPVRSTSFVLHSRYQRPRSRLGRAAPFLLMVLAASCLAPPARGDLLVGALRNDDAVLLIDDAQQGSPATIPAGRGPIAVAIAPSGEVAYVSNYATLEVHAGDDAQVVPGGTVSVIDLARRVPDGVIRLGGATKPHGLKVSRDGDRLWVVSETAGAVLEVVLATRRIVRRWSTRQSGSQLLAVAPDERWLYVGNVGSGSVTVIDRTDGASLVVPVVGGVAGLALAPDGGELWVASAASGRIAVLNARTLALVATVSGAEGSPIPMIFTRDGSELWVCGVEPPVLRVIDVERRAVVRNVTLPEAPRALVEVAPGMALVSQPLARRLLQVDVRSGDVRSRIDTGNALEGMARIRMRPDPTTEQPARRERGSTARAAKHATGG